MGPLELSRRQVLEALAVCGLAGAVAGCVPRRPPLAVTDSGPRTTPVPSAARLTTRLGFGPTPEFLALAERGMDDFLADQLDPGVPESVEMSALFDAIESRGEAIATGEPESGPDNADRRRAAFETTALRTIAGAAWSSRQMHALLTDFWSDHLHVSVVEQPEMFFVPQYDTEVIRTHAMGRFADMLVASARSAAMLVYLDQANSRADGANVPNENYARELMELHTVGVDGGYDETDVIEAAHIFTGWSTRRRSAAFRYVPTWHDLGPLSSAGDVLGFEPGGNGETDGEDFLEHLAHLPATAGHICHRLAIRLVGDDVTADDRVVLDAADAFLAEDTSIPAAVRSIVTSPSFATSPTAFRRPLDLVVAMLRTGCTMPTPEQLEDLVRPVGRTIRALGQTPWSWPAPNGYPLPGAAWIGPGAMVGRWSAALVGAGGFGVLDPAEGTAPTDSDSGTATAARLLGRQPSPALADALSAVDDWAGAPASRSVDPAVAGRALVFASPDFQER